MENLKEYADAQKVLSQQTKLKSLELAIRLTIIDNTTGLERKLTTEELLESAKEIYNFIQR